MDGSAMTPNPELRAEVRQENKGWYIAVRNDGVMGYGAYSYLTHSGWKTGKRRSRRWRSREEAQAVLDRLRACTDMTREWQDTGTTDTLLSILRRGWRLEFDPRGMDIHIRLSALAGMNRLESSAVVSLATIADARCNVFAETLQRLERRLYDAMEEAH
jgi:hypothetical protein